MTVSNPPLQKRRYESKRGVTYSIMLCGANGTGKTTFANNLLETNVFQHRYSLQDNFSSAASPNSTPLLTSILPNSNNSNNNNNRFTPFGSALNGVRVTSPTRSVASKQNSARCSTSTDLLQPLNPADAHIEPGVVLTSTSLDVTSKTIEMADNEGDFFHDVDTDIENEDEDEEDEDEDITSSEESSEKPSSGATPFHLPKRKKENALFHLNLIITHGLGENLDEDEYITEISKHFERQFDLTISEETRINRNPRYKDTRIHVALYFIENTGHGLKEIDIKLMKLLAKYTTVLPIISKADSYTTQELTSLKKFIMKDIEKYNIPIYKFPFDRNFDDKELIKEHQYLSSLQPFAVACSDQKDEDGHYVREYPWGTVPINDQSLFQLIVLKKVLFGSHLQEFKDLTENVLYEKYRVARLTKVGRDVKSIKQRTISNPRIDTTRTSSMTPSTTSSTTSSTVSTATGKYLEHKATDMYHSDSEPSDDETRHYMTPKSSVYYTPETPHADVFENVQDYLKPSDSLVNKPTILRAKNMSKSVPFMLRRDFVASERERLHNLKGMSDTTKDLDLRIRQMELRAKELKLQEQELKRINKLATANVANYNQH
ncbi:hypothetical protein TBLA_0G00420 [Henningerozyma blattae CBS 6284]|uniref:Septin-type G domain-containing protein n=1 Tax=Henningerozyma blattae (strain ATCC 34711 / CBS 6284 / DSM 70876 / NBRC 10599 / NRRL Y-10934 / UCD 77-7) TaxID=1071380 RepID=I2H6I9_HENB6|nr:hypothetical protein TBLA_0G00420 [Tetrapisispora blattae CBS 6284]CCH61991.1 hypothetical protein TBLA_0G00420 [Tetrapisispora blattae CBS 6284]